MFRSFVVYPGGVLRSREKVLKIIFNPCKSIPFRGYTHNLTISIEGNIGSGKTTLLNFCKAKLPGIEVFAEPVHKWQNIGGGNTLALMYADPSRWSYAFQTYVLLTMMQLHDKSESTSVKVMERSAYSAVYCFVENLFLNAHMSKVEYSIHHEWFNWLLTWRRPKVDAFIYLRTSPEKCLQRIKGRSREEEKGVPLALLQQIHLRYEDWLMERTKFTVPAPVFVVNGERPLANMYALMDETLPRILSSPSEVLQRKLLWHEEDFLRFQESARSPRSG